MKGLLWTIALAGALVMGGCADSVDQVKEQANAIKGQVETAVKDLAANLGKEVASLELVNARLVEGAGKVIDLLREMKMNLDFQENGIRFGNDQGIHGLLGINGDTLFLEINSSSRDGNAVQTMVRIANVFSADNTIEEKIDAAAGRDAVQTMQLQNGYVETGPNHIKIYLETYLR